MLINALFENRHTYMHTNNSTKSNYETKIIKDKEN